MKKVFAALAVVLAFSAAQAESPIVTEPTQYGVPQWLKDLNQYFADHGMSAPTTEQCGNGELYPCAPAQTSVPAWLQELNQWAADHGMQAPAFPGDEAP